MFYQETKGEYMTRKIIVQYTIDIHFSCRNNRKSPIFSVPL